MCDYSLMCIPNRLGREGEDLVVHRFPTGSLGFASPLDLTHVASPAQAQHGGFWATLRTFFSPPRHADVPAVCIPPGARLRLDGIPKRIQLDLDVKPSEEITFTQLTASVNTYRDAVRFRNGYQIRLQDLSEGVRAKVVDLSLAEELEPVHEERARTLFGSR
jgi:hypothetical protein